MAYAVCIPIDPYLASTKVPRPLQVGRGTKKEREGRRVREARDRGGGSAQRAPAGEKEMVAVKAQAWQT